MVHHNGRLLFADQARGIAQEVLRVHLVGAKYGWLNSPKDPANRAPGQLSLLRQSPNYVVLDTRVDRGFQRGGLSCLQPECLAGLHSLIACVSQLLAPLHHVLQRGHPQLPIQRRCALPN